MAGVPSTAAEDIVGIFPDLILGGGPWVDIRAYGAVAGGDPTVNANALAAAFAHASAVNLPLFIPTGTFPYNGPGLNYTGNSIIFGTSWGSILDYQGDGVALSVNPALTAQGALLRDFYIKTTAGAPVGGVYLVSDFSGPIGAYQPINIDHLKVSHFDQVDAYNLRIQSVVSAHVANSEFEAGYYDLYIGDVADAYPTTVTFSNTRFRTAIKHGAYILSGLGTYFDDNCVFESNFGCGLKVTTGLISNLGNTRVGHCWFENNMRDNDPADFDMIFEGKAGDPQANVTLTDNVFSGTSGGGNLKVKDLWRLKGYRNSLTSTVVNDSPSTLLNVDWRGNNGGDDSALTYRGNDTYERDMFAGIGVNLRAVGTTGTEAYHSTHQLKGGVVLNSVLADGATARTIATLTENAQGAGELGGGDVFVVGWNDAKTKRFNDTVKVAYGVASARDSWDAVGAPAARTYSVVDNLTLKVTFANDADNYSIRTSQLTN
jgi:hypothetical protein